MTKAELAEKVKTMIADQLGAPVQELEPTTDIYDDLGADSLDLLELFIAAEDELNIEIPDEDSAVIGTTIDTIAGYLAGKLGITE